MTDKVLKRQAAEQAPPPAFLREVIAQNKEQPKVEVGKNREKLLLDLSESDVWNNIVKKFIEAKQLMMAKELRENIDGKSMEEVGFRFLVTDQVNDFIHQFISFVEAPRNAREAQKQSESNNK